MLDPFSVPLLIPVTTVIINVLAVFLVLNMNLLKCRVSVHLDFYPWLQNWKVQSDSKYWKYFQINLLLPRYCVFQQTCVWDCLLLSYTNNINSTLETHLQIIHQQMAFGILQFFLKSDYSLTLFSVCVTPFNKIDHLQKVCFWLL
jgi:hypothetical protein